MGKKIIIVILIIIVLVALFIIPFIWFQSSIKPAGNSQEAVSFEIEQGMTPNKIAEALKEKNLIKSELAFKIYIKLNGVSDFKAGIYDLKQTMELKTIIKTLRTTPSSETATLKITFLEGKNMRWFANKIEEKTNNTADDVFLLLEDEEYIDSLIEEYWFLTDDIKNKDIYYPLEGYLFPDTYNFSNKDVTVKEIFKTLLNQMDKVLSKYKDDIQKSEYSIHKIITMASIVELETKSEDDRKDVASVFYNRLEENMSLGSDVTTYYAVKKEMSDGDLYKSELDKANPYNTRGPNMNGKLPIGPIASVRKSSIEAALYPSNTQYMYFVADKNGKVYFTRTISEHNNKINELKNSGMWFEF